MISANGALTLQVARLLKRIGLHWAATSACSAFDELEWAELAGVGITTLKQPTGRSAMPRLNKWFAALKAPATPYASRFFFLAS